jgi:hypothetical protein
MHRLAASPYTMCDVQTVATHHLAETIVYTKVLQADSFAVQLLH